MNHCCVYVSSDRNSRRHKSDPNRSRFTEKYDITLSDMAKAELRGHFKEAVLAWVDAAADPTKGVELV